MSAGTTPPAGGARGTSVDMDSFKSKLPPFIIDYNGQGVDDFDLGERTSAPLALQMLIQSGILAGSDEDEPRSPTTPLSPHTPGLTQDLEVLDNACSLGSCTHILASLNEKGLVNVPPGGTLRLTALETPEDFRPFESPSGLREKVARNKWQNVRVLNGHMNALPWLGPHFTHIFTNITIVHSASDDQAIHEMYRCLLPNGIAAFSSWKSLGWTYDVGVDPGGPGDPLSIFPSNGWRDPRYITKKLETHGFRDIQITEYAFSNTVRSDIFDTIVRRIVRHAVDRLWSSENDGMMAEGDSDAIADSVFAQYEGHRFNGHMVAWITTARKPASSQ